MDSFGPGIFEARRFITQVLDKRQDWNRQSLILDANVCYSSRSYPRIVKICGAEHVGLAGPENAPFALMVFKLLPPPLRIVAYDGKKVDNKELLIDGNDYMWQTHNSWRVAEYEKCEECVGCKYKGKVIEMPEDTEPHMFNLVRALDEISETSTCFSNEIRLKVKLLKHFKNILDKALVVANFGEVEDIKLEVKMPLGKFALKDGVLTCSDVPPGLEYVSYFCKAVSAFVKEKEEICVDGDKIAAQLFSRMFALAAKYGTEDAYSVMMGENAGFTWWRTEEISDENAYNLSVLKNESCVQTLAIDWNCVNTAEIRRDHVHTFHWGGRLDGTPVTITDRTRYGEICPPPMKENRPQLEYLRLDAENQIEVSTHDGKRALLIVNSAGALVATTRVRTRWKSFLKVVRGIGISPVTLAFDFSSLSEEDSCHTTVATRILMGYYGEKGMRFLLEMAHKGRLHVSKHSPNRCFVPQSCLKSHGVVLGVAMPLRAFKHLVFCCRERNGKADRDHIYWKPTKDGNLFRLDSVAMNLVHMKETEKRVDELKVCKLMLRKDVG